MNKILIILFVFVGGCLTAPDFERTNPYDLKGGVPRIWNFQYRFTISGLSFAWIDGSVDNDDFILTQKAYSSGDSLVKHITLPGDSYVYVDKSGKYGYPYLVNITSNIYDNNGTIIDQRKDSVSVSFGTLSLGSLAIRNDSLEIRAKITKSTPAIQSIVFDVQRNGMWERYSEIMPNQFLFKFPENELDELNAMRFGITINDFNDERILADNLIVHAPFR
jgi:hypothetical protein